MGQKDFFYEIAQTKHPAGTTDREVAMRKVSNHYFKETARQRLKPIWEIGYEEQKEKFYQELEEQKAYYRPFLSNHLSSSLSFGTARRMSAFRIAIGRM